jgi:hypothetical protein
MLSAKTVFEEILDNDKASRLFCSEVGGERAVLAWHGPNHSPGNIFIHPGPATTTEPIRNYSSRGTHKAHRRTDDRVVGWDDLLHQHRW